MIWSRNPKANRRPAAEFPGAFKVRRRGGAAAGAPFPRMRRNRKAEWTRRLVRENVLTAADLIWPIFVCEGVNLRQPIASMPGVQRLSIDAAVDGAREAKALGIPAIALFPYTDPALRDEAGSEAHNPENLICRAVRAIKETTPGTRPHHRRRARSLYQPRP